MPIPTALKAAVIDELVGIGQDLLNVAPTTGNPTQLGEYIANGEPNSVVGRIGQASLRQSCNAYAGQRSTLDPESQNWWDKACGPWLCGSGGCTDWAPSPPPFTGGQCQGVLYTWELRNLNGGGCAASTPFTSFGNAFGPIRGKSSRPSGNPNFPIQLGVLDGNNAFRPGGKAASANCELGAAQLVITGRVDGQPDNCGNISTPIAPPSYPAPPPVPPVTVGPGGPTVGIDVDINPDGTISISFDGEPGDDVGIRPSGDATPVRSGGEPVGDLAGPGTPIQGNGGNPSDGEGEDIDFPAPAAGFIYVGAYVVCDFPPEYGNIPGTQPNEVLARAAGETSLKYAGERGTSKAIRSAWTEIFRSNPNQVITGVFVRVLPGITYSVLPFQVERCPDAICGD